MATLGDCKDKSFKKEIYEDENRARDPYEALVDVLFINSHISTQYHK